VYLRDAFDLAPVGLAVVRDGDRIVDVNRAAAALLGRPAGEVVGRPLGSLVADGSRDALANLLTGTATGLSLPHVDVVVGSDGTAVTLRLHAARLQRAASLTVLMIEDVTEHHERIGTLLHELRNPLAPLRMSVAVLQKLGITSERAREAVDIIGRSAERLLRLLDDLQAKGLVSRVVRTRRASTTDDPRSEP
jgi:PAS domain S-box-containing protein